MREHLLDALLLVADGDEKRDRGEGALVATGGGAVALARRRELEVQVAGNDGDPEDDENRDRQGQRAAELRDPRKREPERERRPGEACEQANEEAGANAQIEALAAE